MFGEGSHVKAMIYASSIAVAGVLLLAGVGFMARAEWWRSAWIAGVVFSLLARLLFWHREFWINVGLLALVLFTNWGPGE